MDNKKLVQILLNKYKEKDISGLTHDFSKKEIYIDIPAEKQNFHLLRNELCDEIGDKKGFEIWEWIKK